MHDSTKFLLFATFSLRLSASEVSVFGAGRGKSLGEGRTGEGVDMKVSSTPHTAVLPPGTQNLYSPVCIVFFPFLRRSSPLPFNKKPPLPPPPIQNPPLPPPIQPPLPPASNTVSSPPPSNIKISPPPSNTKTYNPKAYLSFYNANPPPPSLLPPIQ